MKIVGLDGKGNYLCSVSPLEIRFLCTFDEVKQPSIDWVGNCGMVGKQFEIDKLYGRIRKLQSNRKELDSVIRQLRACADILEPLAPIVDLGPEAFPSVHDIDLSSDEGTADADENC